MDARTTPSFTQSVPLISLDPTPSTQTPRALGQETIARALAAIAVDFDPERLREIDGSLRRLPDAEATREDVEQMFDVTLAWSRGGQSREALPIAIKALRRARALNDPLLLRKALNCRGAVADGTLDIGTAIECLLEALSIAEAQNDVHASKDVHESWSMFRPYLFEFGGAKVCRESALGSAKPAN